MARTYTKTTQADVVRISDVLKNALETGKSPDGLVMYRPGWDDAKVAMVVDPTGRLSKDHIKTMRQHVYGVLKHAKNPEVKGVYVHDDSELRARVEVAEKKIIELNDRLTYLEDRLGERKP